HLPQAARVLFPDPRPDHEESTGKRHRHQLPFGDLLHERGPAARCRGYDCRRQRLGSLARQSRHRGDTRRPVLAGRARAPGLSRALSQRLHLSLHPAELGASKTANGGRRGHDLRENTMRRLGSLLTAFLLSAASLPGQTAAPEVLLRLDDIGMNHSVNLAVEKVAATGIPFSVSLLFACPWYQEAVEILKKYPQVTVGVHLALNSEWRNYRWGPVLGKGGVPSLVDSVGYFLPSSTAFLASKYDLGEVERELSAQVERALASGLKITYVD